MRDSGERREIYEKKAKGIERVKRTYVDWVERKAENFNRERK